MILDRRLEQEERILSEMNSIRRIGSQKRWEKFGEEREKEEPTRLAIVLFYVRRHVRKMRVSDDTCVERYKWKVRG